MEELPRPEERADQIGRTELEASLRETLRRGALSHGWIISGGVGAGKATLAYRLARAVLAPDALTNETGFDIDTRSQTFKLVAQNAHPDLYVAQRQWIEKTSKYQTEVTVETIRSLIHFMNLTPAFGGARVAIIDSADEMNRSAANALLKILEEPPTNTLLLLLSASPGRLLATLRSRCRRIVLRDVAREEIVALLEREGAATGADAERIADHASGRPGYALSLAAEGGAKALSLADKFLRASRGQGEAGPVAASFSAKTPAEEWRFFAEAITTQLADAARVAGRAGPVEGPLKGARPESLVEGWEHITALAARGEGLNLDRSQLVSAMAFDLARILGRPS